MAKIPFNFGGGSGNGSDDCTAEAQDVLIGTTAIYKGSDDEPKEGTMANHSGVSLSATTSLNTSNNRLEMAFPETGKYTTSSKLYTSYSNVASVIGLTSAKLATGNTALGISGSYTGLGNATASQVLSGKKFSTANLSNATGTMTNVEAIDSAKSVSLSSGIFYCRMTNGAHITNASSGYPEVSVTQGTVASTIGLSASQIVYGNTVLGISGTAVSPGSVASTGLDLYAFGQEGITCTGYSTTNNSGAVLTGNQGILTKASTCIAFCGVGVDGGLGTLSFNGASVALGSYSTIHIQARCIGGGATWTIRAYYSSSPQTRYGLTGGSTAGSIDVSLNSTSSTTITIDISSLSGSYYLALNVAATSTTWLGVALEHVWLT